MSGAAIARADFIDKDREIEADEKHSAADKFSHARGPTNERSNRSLDCDE